MSSYVTYNQFITSAYGKDFTLDSCSLFSASGDIQSFLDQVSSIIDLYAGQSFGVRAFSQTFRANGESYLYANRFPLNSITSITYQLIPSAYNSYYSETSFSSTSSGVVAPSNYIIYPDGKILFVQPLKVNAVYTINGTCGYTVVPPPIVMATMMLANVMAQSAVVGAVASPDGGQVVSMGFNKFEEKYVDPSKRIMPNGVGIPLTVWTILQRFRLIR